MIRLQDDILGIYNSLTDFSGNTILGPIQYPIRVTFSESLNSLCFEQKGLKVAIYSLNYYCENLTNLKDSYLLPEDYDKLMSTLSDLVNGGKLLEDRVCLSPKPYGFKVYLMSRNLPKEGPQLLADIKFISGNSWIRRKLIKLVYKI